MLICQIVCDQCVTGIEVKLDKGVRLGELADRDPTAKTDTAASELIDTAKLNKVYPHERQEMLFLWAEIYLITPRTLPIYLSVIHI